VRRWERRNSITFGKQWFTVELRSKCERRAWGRKSDGRKLYVPMLFFAIVRYNDCYVVWEMAISVEWCLGGGIISNILYYHIRSNIRRTRMQHAP